MLAADGFADLRIGHLNRDHAIADLYFLSSLPNLHGRVDLQRAVYVNRHTYLLIGLETGRTDLKFVLANRNDWERILSLAVRGSGLVGSIVHILESNCCTSDECATGITNHPRDASRHIGPSGVQQKAKRNNNPREPLHR